METNSPNIQDYFDDLFEHFSFDADIGQNPLRVDKFLMNRIENATRNKIQHAAKQGFIIVNNKPVKPSYKVKPKDNVKVMFHHPPHENLIIAEDIELDLTYEDDHIIIVNKPPNLVVHPGHGNYNGTLLNGLIHHFENLPKNVDGRPGLVHRIDKDTSGLLVIAKTNKALTNLSKQFLSKSIKRKYVALVWGSLLNKSGTIDESLARDKKNRMIMSVPGDSTKGKRSITHYRVIDDLGYVSLVECELETGRTHQIRAHMKHIGHPIFNDARYGGDRILKGTIFSKYKQFVENAFKLLPRQALHAKTLGFNHPESEEKIFFESELPDDFSLCYEKWKNYSKNI